MTAPKKTAGNQGIQANSVVADVLAVGQKATAYKNVQLGGQPGQVLEAITQLRVALNHAALPLPDKQAIAGHLDELASTSVTTKPERSKVQAILKSVCETLKSAGVAIKDISELCDPIMKIAEFAAVPLHLIGL